MLASPSVLGASGRPKWGLAILVRSHIGIIWSHEGGIVVPARVMRAIVDIPQWPPITVMCCVSI
eukprot:6155966-Pyramimonas_sp.AAC.1